MDCGGSSRITWRTVQPLDATPKFCHLGPEGSHLRRRRRDRFGITSSCDQPYRARRPAEDLAECSSLVGASDWLTGDVRLQRLVGHASPVDLGNCERQLFDSVRDRLSDSDPILSHRGAHLHPIESRKLPKFAGVDGYLHRRNYGRVVGLTC